MGNKYPLNIQFRLKREDYDSLVELMTIFEKVHTEVAFDSLNDFCKKIILNRIRKFQKEGN